jgi:hypothetical protein
MQWRRATHKICGLGDAFHLWRSAIDLRSTMRIALAPIRRRFLMNPGRVVRSNTVGGALPAVSARSLKMAHGFSSRFVKGDMPINKLLLHSVYARPDLTPGRKAYMSVSLLPRRSADQDPISSIVNRRRAGRFATYAPKFFHLQHSAAVAGWQKNRLKSLHQTYVDKNNKPFQGPHISLSRKGELVRFSPVQTKGQPLQHSDYSSGSRMPLTYLVSESTSNEVALGNLPNSNTCRVERVVRLGIDPKSDSVSGVYRGPGANYLVRQARMPPSGMSGYDPRLSPMWAGLQISG